MINNHHSRAILKEVNNLLQSEIKEVQKFNLPDNFGSLKKTVDRFVFEDVYEQILNFYEYINETFDFNSVYGKIYEGKYDFGIALNERFKTKESIKLKWQKKLPDKIPLNKVCNDTFAIRIIVPFKREDLSKMIKETYPEQGTKIVDYYSKTKSVDDGYRGIHIYIKQNSKCFPVEIQYWNREDALLNFYTHELIYKGSIVEKKQLDFENPNQYSLYLRKWLDCIPEKPEYIKKSFIDFWYEQFTE